MKKSLLIVANWKTYIPFHKAIEHFLRLQEMIITMPIRNNVIVCPPLLALSTIATLRTSDRINLGAQTCSAFMGGAHTGDIDAYSLQQLGCSFCLVGHSERRNDHHENDEQITHQVERLFETGITPIICVGETQKERDNNLTMQVIIKQLTPIFTRIAKHYPDKTIYVAYEPRWSIGTNNIPTSEDIEHVFNTIITYAHQCTIMPPYLLYGGSVDLQTSAALHTISSLSGFLVGRASLDNATLLAMLS